MTTAQPFRIGIIGAENSHATRIATIINISGLAPGFAVTHIWGEKETFAVETAKAGCIPTIVRDPAEMLGKIDGLMIDHRDGKYHLAAARPFVEAGIPVFVDKPFSTSLAEAREFLKWRREKHGVVTTMSTLPHQACAAMIKEKMKTIGKLRTVHFSGPGDSHSPWGGVWFYGIHQIELMVGLLGTDAKTVTATDDGGTFMGVIRYPEGVTATMAMAGASSFSVTAIGTDGAFHVPFVSDSNSYLATTAIFTRMFTTREEPFDDVRMLAPIAIMEALSQAVETGRQGVVSPVLPA